LIKKNGLCEILVGHYHALGTSELTKAKSESLNRYYIPLYTSHYASPANPAPQHPAGRIRLP
jgi:hypothetical protein